MWSKCPSLMRFYYCWHGTLLHACLWIYMFVWVQRLDAHRAAMEVNKTIVRTMLFVRGSHALSIMLATFLLWMLNHVSHHNHMVPIHNALSITPSCCEGFRARLSKLLDVSYAAQKAFRYSVCWEGSDDVLLITTGVEKIWLIPHPIFKFRVAACTLVTITSNTLCCHVSQPHKWLEWNNEQRHYLLRVLIK